MNKDDYEDIYRYVVIAIGESYSINEITKIKKYRSQPQVNRKIALVILTRRILNSLRTILVLIR